MALLLLSGCARNAVLELDVALPADGLTHAELVALPGAPTFGTPVWDEAEPERLTELGDVAPVQIVADGSSLESPLGVLVRLCDGTPCPPDAPEVRVEIERAFYVGRRTWLTLSIPVVPNDDAQTIPVERCEVGGCLDGDTLDFCRVDGAHYCE